MPIYTYKCQGEGCTVVAEKTRYIADRDESIGPCPSCGGEFKRQIDRPGSVWAPTAGGYR